ncbi:syntaxin family protein [Ferruginibacter sp.]
MTEKTIQNTIKEDDGKITYEQFGAREAANRQGNPEQLKESLSIIYAKIVEDARIDKHAIVKRIETNSKEIVDLENRIHSLEAKRVSLQDEVDLAEKQIEDIEQNRGNADIFPFIIATIITVLLTFYLWAFYAASGYAALNGVKEGKTGFSGIFSALADAFNKGGFVVVLTVLFPIIFLGLGFLIHDALEKKKYGMIFILLLFTLCFDAIIGYNISKHIYINEYNTEQPR